MGVGLFQWASERPELRLFWGERGGVWDGKSANWTLGEGPLVAGFASGAETVESASALMSGGGVDAFEDVEVVAAEQERESAEDGEAGVDALPEKGDTAERTGDEGEKKNAATADEAEVDDPAVADGIVIRAEEEDGEEDVGEGQPVGAVGEEGRCQKAGGERAVDAQDSVKERGAGAEVDGEGEVIEQPLRLAKERKGSQAVKKEGDHDDGETETDAGEKARGFRRTDQGGGGHVSGMPAGMGVV